MIDVDYPAIQRIKMKQWRPEKTGNATKILLKYV
jgi:hypothetical protein